MTSFLSKKAILGFIVLLILVAGLTGGLYLSQRQTQIKSKASYFTTYDQQVCKNTNCNACRAATTCDQETFDNCNNNTVCHAAGATATTLFHCFSSDNPTSCAGDYECGSCVSAPANPPANPPATSATGSISAQSTTVTKNSGGNWNPVRLTISAQNVPSGVKVFMTQPSCNSNSNCESQSGWTEIYSIGGATAGVSFDWTNTGQLPAGTHAFSIWNVGSNGNAEHVLGFTNITFTDSSSGGGGTGGQSGGTSGGDVTASFGSVIPNPVGQTSGIWAPVKILVQTNGVRPVNLYYHNINGGCDPNGSGDCNKGIGWNPIQSNITGGSTVTWNPGADIKDGEKRSLGLFDSGSGGALLKIADVNFKADTPVTPPTGTGTTGTCPVPNQFDADKCQVCAADGSHWILSYGDKGGNPPNPTWCACAIKNNDQNFAKDQGCDINAAGSAQGNPDDASVCEDPIQYLDPKTNQAAPYFIENMTYIIRMIMKNTGKSIWKAGTYLFTPSALTAQTWGAAAIPLDRDVLPGGEKIFDVRVKAPATSNGEHRTVGLFYQMTNNNIGFSSACEPQAIDITPTPAAAVNTQTACFVMSENLPDVSAITKCDDPTGLSKGIIHPYTGDPTTLPYSFQADQTGLIASGVKTIYVRFISTTGTTKDISKQITYSPAPVLDTIICTHSASGQGTVIGIKGQNFGSHLQQGAGYVKVNGQNANITSWDPAKNIVVATTTKLLEGENPVELGLDDGRTVSGHCTVGVSSIQFTVNTQCSLPNTFNADNVDVRVQEATTGAKPFVAQKIKINNGQPQDFAPNVETGKKYSLIIKAPMTLVRKVDFVADEGTKNLGEINMWIGDIAPKSKPDGKINTVDKKEIVREWSALDTGGARTADFNGDGAVNVHDYSCMKSAFNQQDEANISGQ